MLTQVKNFAFVQHLHTFLYSKTGFLLQVLNCSIYHTLLSKSDCWLHKPPQDGTLQLNKFVHFETIQLCPKRFSQVRHKIKCQQKGRSQWNGSVDKAWWPELTWLHKVVLWLPYIHCDTHTQTQIICNKKGRIVATWISDCN